MKCEEIEHLLPDYFQGTLAASQSQLVEDHLQECGQCREEVELWKKLASIPEVAPSPESRARFRGMLEAYQEGRWEKRRGAEEHNNWRELLGGWWPRVPAAALAWAVLLVVVGFMAGRSWNREVPTPNPDVASLRNEVVSMRQLLVLSLLRQQSAGERLQAISWSRQDAAPDPQVLDALLHTLRYDNSVDVRLSALDALSRYHSRHDVQDAFLQALQTEQSPLVQVALIDLMVETRNTGAVEQFKKFEQDPNANPAVRQRATWAIRQLT